MTLTVQSWRAAEAKLFVSFYDAVLAQLLAAAGKPDEARHRLNEALHLSEETGVQFYRAELLRLRAQVAASDDTRATDLRAAIEVARKQNASIFELRAAMDYFNLNGGSARGTLTDVVGRFPVDSGWPELVRARAMLG
jgi:predicted ATPase